MTTQALRTVANWYSKKTESIIEKYGPGPRIHFHMGLVRDRAPARDAGPLRAAMVKSQERTMERAAAAWGFDARPPRELLDVGCGVGGGSIYWAQRYGARVDALTITEDHLPIVRELASGAGVDHLIRPLHGDAHSFESSARYDAIVAFESSCYFDRFAWFANVRRHATDRARIGIEDAFLVEEPWREPFDSYWHTRIETVRHYAEAAAASGFRLVSNIDVTAEAIDFWTLSIEWNDARMKALDGEAPDRARLRRSNEWHTSFRGALQARGCEVRLLMFERMTHG